MKSTDIKNHKTSISQTHNLEVLGSSPSWSTLKIKHLREVVSAFSFVGDLQVTFLKRNFIKVNF